MKSLRFALLSGLLALGACSTSPYHANPELSQTYACNGADPMDDYSECDKPDHFAEHQRMHQHDGDHHDASYHGAGSYGAASYVGSSKGHR